MTTAAVPLSDVLQAYVAHLRVRRKANTARIAEYHVQKLLDGLGADLNVVAFQRSALDNFIAAKRKRGVPVSTVNAHLRILRAACNLAAEPGGILPTAPKIKLLRETKAIPTVLAPEAVRALLEKADPQVRLAVLLAANAGLRHAEVLHLRGEDIDLEQGILRVSAKKWGSGRSWSPKAHAERVVPLNAELRAALAAAPSRGWLFPGKTDGPRDGLYVEVRQAFRDAGLYSERPGLHKLRRTFASRLLERGADVNTVRELGGWADLVTTQRYLVSSDDAKRSAVKLLEG
jgi:integrase